MFAPKLYKVIKLPLKFVIESDFDVKLTKSGIDKYVINQQDNMLFRQIRLITHRSEIYNPYVIFVDATGWKTRQDELNKMIKHGIKINGNPFIISERSASMSRNSILSFVDFGIYPELNARISMDAKIDKTVLSKYMAYRGLMFSSCHNLEGYITKIIVVKDYETVIPKQTIKHLKDEVVHFVDENNNERDWKQKGVEVSVKDITINCFDGCGIHHPAITQQVKQMLLADNDPTSILWRAPFIKGITHEMDYTSFFKSKEVDYIQDYWGRWHDVRDEMIILTESMYKGLKYFKTTGTSLDWDDYWNRFMKYEHCLGVAKWNFDWETEPAMTRGNYQILQDLRLPYEEFKTLKDKTVNYYEAIINGDEPSVYSFLGLRADKQKEMNLYMKSLLKNPEMIKEEGVRNYLTNMLRKKMDEMKCGKIYLDACFRFLSPDLITLMEHIGGLPVVGVLNSEEFWTSSGYKEYDGEYLIERNPHLSHSEHVILNSKCNKEVNSYFGHLSNVCIINSLSLTSQRLNGADWRVKNKSCSTAM